MSMVLRGKLVRRNVVLLAAFLLAGFAAVAPVAATESSRRVVAFKNGVEVQQLQYPVKILTKKRFNFTAVSTGLEMLEIARDNVTYHQVRQPGGKVLGEAGLPGLPGFTRFVLVPQGAKVQVTVTEGKPRVLDGYLLYPVQPPVSNQVQQAPPPFVIDEKFYKTDSTYPERLYDVRYETVRGCRVAIVSVRTARYNPARRRLLCYPEIQVDIRFTGGEGTYIPLRRRSPFLEASYGAVFANYKIIEATTADLVASIPLRDRCDLLIVTPTVFKEAADTLAAWKREKGFVTRVVTLDDIEAAKGGTEAADIRAYIKDVYLFSNLSYVLLLGDVVMVPTNYLTPDPDVPFEAYVPTDLYYAEMDGSGVFPDLGIGRLSVDRLLSDDPAVDEAAQAKRVVDKIVSYERNPPGDRDFYRRILHAGYFEDLWEGWTTLGYADGKEDKSYIQELEEVRDFFAATGYSFLPRQYYTVDYYWPPDDPSLGNPRFFFDFTPLPGELLMPGFAWDGSAAGIVEQLNLGAFLAVYRGHGAEGAWCGPSFPASCEWEPEGCLEAIANGNKTPVLFSITCITGWFDKETQSPGWGTPSETESFAENLLRMEGGAVAVVAASRDTDTGTNKFMLNGLIASIWDPAFAPVDSPEGGASPLTGSRRLGDALNYAKYHLCSQIEGSFGGETTCQLMSEKYHLFGDPTMEIWTSCPYVSPLPENPGLYDPIVPMKPVYRFPVNTDGVLVSLIQGGRIIGQGVSSKGSAKIKLDRPLPSSGGTRLSLAKQGFLTQSVQLTFRGGVK